MKFSFGILLSAIAVINAAVIDIDNSNAEDILKTFVTSPTPLFNSAQDYHEQAKELQDDINKHLADIRSTLSSVLAEKSREALDDIQLNSNDILELENSTRTALFELDRSLCVDNLRVLLNKISEFTGFGSSNCVTAYDINIQKGLGSAYEKIRSYDGSFGDVQQIVVRSFIGANAFLEPEEIEARFVGELTRQRDEWNAARPEIGDFINSFNVEMEAHRLVLGTCFKTIQDNVAPGYDSLQSEIATCLEFDNTDDPFAAFR
ncbi:CLUMA_CG016965, isoform A [Clunio marinus]|uniref:CLUMA_CG016965, isoform A n=1 Tax=Clunio marinus TaxID=568069 RepID=A0A1J1IU12_9DIPT|nr:CLUMA_CG016965, isoform A [Clunio marinus]